MLEIGPNQTSGRLATLHTNGWGAQQTQPCIVIAETPGHYRVKAPHGGELRLPMRGGALRLVLSSGSWLVPKQAITFVTAPFAGVSEAQS